MIETTDNTQNNNRWQHCCHCEAEGRGNLVFFPLPDGERTKVRGRSVIFRVFCSLCVSVL